MASGGLRGHSFHYLGMVRLLLGKLRSSDLKLFDLCDLKGCWRLKEFPKVILVLDSAEVGFFLCFCFSRYDRVGVENVAFTLR